MRAALRLARRLPDGATERDHLRSLWRQTGKRPAALDGSDPPPGCDILVAAFWGLHASRSGTGFGVNPIPPSEVLAWCRLRGISLTPWEADTLAAMDSAAMQVLNDQRKEPSE